MGECLLLQVIAGQATEIFKRHPMPSHARWSFSLLYKEDDEELRTLDLTCKNEQEFTLWYWGIQVGPVTMQAFMCLASYINTISMIVDSTADDNRFHACQPRFDGCDSLVRVCQADLFQLALVPAGQDSGSSNAVQHTDCLCVKWQCMRHFGLASVLQLPSCCQGLPV